MGGETGMVLWYKYAYGTEQLHMPLDTTVILLLYRHKYITIVYHSSYLASVLKFAST